MWTKKTVCDFWYLSFGHPLEHFYTVLLISNVLLMSMCIHSKCLLKSRTNTSSEQFTNSMLWHDVFKIIHSFYYLCRSLVNKIYIHYRTQVLHYINSCNSEGLTYCLFLELICMNWNESTDRFTFTGQCVAICHTGLLTKQSITEIRRSLTLSL